MGCVHRCVVVKSSSGSFIRFRNCSSSVPLEKICSFQIIGFVCNPTEIAILRKRQEKSTLAHLFHGCLLFIARLGRKCAERPINKNDERGQFEITTNIVNQFSRAFKLINQCVYAIDSHRGVRGWRESVGTMTEAIYGERGERGEGRREGAYVNLRPAHSTESTTFPLPVRFPSPDVVRTI